MNERRILVVAHARRDDTVRAAHRVVAALRAAGATPVFADIDPRTFMLGFMRPVE